MNKNQDYTEEVLSLGTEGEGIIKCGQYTAFVPFCLPGERVTFKVLKSSGNVAYGRLEKVLSPSRERVEPPCPHFKKCGGCQLQHAGEGAQLKFKQNLVKNALKKIGGIDFDVACTVPSQKQYGYRNKLALPVGVDGQGNTVVGFYAPRSHRIVPINQCILQQDWSYKLISCLLSFMKNSGLSGYDELKHTGDVRHLIAREVEGKLIITVVARTDLNLKPLEKLLSDNFGQFTLWLNVNASTGNALVGKEWRLVCGEGFFMGEDCGIKFKAGANTFLQVNDGVRSLLYRAVTDEMEGGCTAIDLYSGGGMLTAMLAKACGRAYGIEIVQEATDCANQLKKLNGLEDKMFNICGAVEDKLAGVLATVPGKKIIVCDPPRKGMERSVVNAVLASGADKVVLISCNPATLARDLGLLCGTLKEQGGQLVKGSGGGNYKIISITPYDMFPQTKHVETLVVLSHNKQN